MDKKLILIVDNERHIQRLLQFTLEKTGAAVRMAGSGEEALKILTETPADLMLIDLVMPGMDGFATVRELRKNPALQQMPIIMLTSRGQSEAREQATELGIVAFYTKPFSPVELIAESRRILGL